MKRPAIPGWRLCLPHAAERTPMTNIMKVLPADGADAPMSSLPDGGCGPVPDGAGSQAAAAGSVVTAQTPASGDPLWYKDAVIYQVHVKSFFDSNGDGVGDFPGLVSKLDYIAGLGVDTIWLLPFYPSPRRDDGYDIADYKGVHPDYGTLDDVKAFIAAVHARGMRVITELVMNHTSDQHPWFQRARNAEPGSAWRDYYVWSDDDRKYGGTRIIFTDTERSNWTWDPVAKAYYWHRFFSHQPDLNFDNPQVMKEMLGVLHCWLEMGVDGLRLDAVPYLIERDGTNNENLPETHDALKRVRAEMNTHFGDRMLLAEANQWPEDTKDYFGDGDECHMAFNFPLMPRMYMAIAREDRFPISDILRQIPEIPESCQWAVFLRNHDELTLEMVTASEREFLWDTYAPDRRARINVGIRRRLAPLLENDRRRIELLNCLLFSMRGTPVIYYGDEIGMGDNINLGDRDGVRTPMQWSPDRNGGFSSADYARCVLPAIMDPLYGFGSVNVESQQREPYSLLNWTRRTLAVRRQHKAFGRGTLRLLYPENRKILAYLREHEGTTILCVANLSRTPQATELGLAEFAGRVPVELGGGSVFPPIGQSGYPLTLPPFGFYWFSLPEAAAGRTEGPAPAPLPELRTVVMRGDLAGSLAAWQDMVENEVLPPWLAQRRWFAAKDLELQDVRIASLTPLPDTEIVLAEVETDTLSGTSRWLLPMAAMWEDHQADGSAPAQPAIARVRRGPSAGLLSDGFALPEFAHTVIAGFAASASVPARDGEIRFEPTPALHEAGVQPGAEVTCLAAEQSNSSVIIGHTAVLKLFRRITDGPHPEAEMSRYLTAQGFANTPPLLGEMVRVGADGTRHTLAVAHGFVANQGDAWNWTLDLLMRGLSGLACGACAGADALLHRDYARFARLMGQRIAEMHAILARPSEDPAFAPERAGTDTVAQWAAQAGAQLGAASGALGARRGWDRGALEDASTFTAAIGYLSGRIPALAAAAVGTQITRIHGDLHLGQLLVADGDVHIIDFEGEPSRPASARRAKSHRMRDAAGMIRSFGYAAAVAQRQSADSHPGLTEAMRDAYLDGFVATATEAFLSGYGSMAGEAAYPDAALLDLFLLEKAAYEVCYEAANRPHWIGVPLRGLAQMAGRMAR